MEGNPPNFYLENNIMAFSLTLASSNCFHIWNREEILTHFMKRSSNGDTWNIYTADTNIPLFFCGLTDRHLLQERARPYLNDEVPIQEFEIRFSLTNDLIAQGIPEGSEEALHMAIKKFRDLAIDRGIFDVVIAGVWFAETDPETGAAYYMVDYYRNTPIQS